MARLCCSAQGWKKEYAVTEEQVVQNWLMNFVVGHNICPFAKKPLLQKRVRINILDTFEEEELTKALLTELGELVAAPRADLETSLLVFPHLLVDFDDFWAYWEWTQELLVATKTEGLVQLVGFHPDFYFGESDQDDLANYTNRSPYPLLHLLREESVEEVVSQFEGIDEIPTRNAAYLNTLKRQLLEDLRNGHDE